VQGREAAFDAAILGAILFLVVATPLALGSVHPLVVSILEWACLALLLLWIVRSVWVPPPDPSPGPEGGAATRRLSLFGHPLAATGIEIPVALFLAVVVLQLLPLPASIVRLISPSTAGLFEASLPGWGTPQDIDFGKTGSFLLGPGHDGVVKKIISSPGALPIDVTTTSSSFRPLTIYPYATFNRLLVLLALFALFTVVVNTIRSRSRIRSVVRTLVLLGFGLSVFGILQRLAWNGKIYWLVDLDEGASPFGPFINHNHFASFLGMIVPVAAGMMMDEARGVLPGSRRSSASAFAFHGPEPFARLILKAFIVAVMIAAMVFCASRGAVLALGLALVFYGGSLAMRGRVGRGEALFALVLLALAAGLSLWLGIGPLAQKLQAFGSVENEPSLLARVVGWRYTLRIIGSYPLLGTGLGTFSEAWRGFYPAGTSYIWHEAHNDYLQLFSETGLAGMSIFVAALAIFAWRYLLPGVTARGLNDTYAIHGIAVGIFAVALHSLVDFPLQINACAVLLVVMAGVLIAHRRRKESAA